MNNGSFPLAQLWSNNADQEVDDSAGGKVGTDKVVSQNTETEGGNRQRSRDLGPSSSCAPALGFNL